MRQMQFAAVGVLPYAQRGLVVCCIVMFELAARVRFPLSAGCVLRVCVCDNEALYKLIITALEVESLGWATETISNIEQ